MLDKKSDIGEIIMGGDRDRYIGTIIKKKTAPKHRVLTGIPMTGLVRSEWMIARYGQVIPCNFSQVDMIQYIDQYSPINYMVHDARNLIVKEAVEKDFEWVFFIDHDVILPADTLLRVNERMLQGNVPVWSGLYFTRSTPAEPLIYRGKGTGYYKNWKIGDEVWVDGLPMGCTVIHTSILKTMYSESEEYEAYGTKLRKVFETPAAVWYDPELRGWHAEVGTEDINWCHKVITNKIFDKSGWPEYQEKEWPFLIDTNMYCRHIDMNGIQYPANGEEFEFVPDEVKKDYENHKKFTSDRD